MYIIDGNNVAGKLKILGEENFDRKFLSLVMKWNTRKRVKITVVFDSGDWMGDKQILDSYVRAVYTPQDSFYRDADDKIVEIIRRNYLSPGEAMILVTEDRELITRAQEEARQAGQKIEILSSGEFAIKLGAVRADEEADRELSKEKMDDITTDLLNEWT